MWFFHLFNFRTHKIITHVLKSERESSSRIGILYIYQIQVEAKFWLLKFIVFSIQGIKLPKKLQSPLDFSLPTWQNFYVALHCLSDRLWVVLSYVPLLKLTPTYPDSRLHNSDRLVYLTEIKAKFGVPKLKRCKSWRRADRKKQLRPQRAISKPRNRRWASCLPCDHAWALPVFAIWTTSTSASNSKSPSFGYLVILGADRTREECVTSSPTYRTFWASVANLCALESALGEESTVSLPF